MVKVLKPVLVASAKVSGFAKHLLVTILRYDFGLRVAIEYGKRLKESKICTLVRLLPADEEKAWELFCKYSDQDFSFADCTSFAFMQRLEIKEVAAFDVHFEVAGLVRLPFVPLKKK